MELVIHPPSLLVHEQAAAELEAVAGERDQLRAQLAEQQAAAAEAAKEADAARAAVQGEVNTARQRIQAAEKARLELEVGFGDSGFVPSLACVLEFLSDMCSCRPEVPPSLL